MHSDGGMAGLDNDRLRAILMAGLAAEDEQMFGAALDELIRRSDGTLTIWLPDGRGVELRRQ
jgi:hypothetical protein